MNERTTDGTISEETRLRDEDTRDGEMPAKDASGKMTTADLAYGRDETSSNAPSTTEHEGDERVLFVVLSGKIEVTKSIDGPEFGLFLDLMRWHENVWTKVSCPERLSVSGPPALDGEHGAYRDVVPFARRVVETFSDRVLWGTDWPHPNLKDHMPDDGLLVDVIPNVATTPELRTKLLVTNPMRLYWPEEKLGKR